MLFCGLLTFLKLNLQKTYFHLLFILFYNRYSNILTEKAFKFLENYVSQRTSYTYN